MSSTSCELENHKLRGSLEQYDIHELDEFYVLDDIGRRSYYGRPHKQIIIAKRVSVEKVTKTQIRLSNNTRIRKSDQRVIGGGWVRCPLIPINEETTKLVNELKTNADRELRELKIRDQLARCDFRESTFDLDLAERFLESIGSYRCRQR